MKQRFRSTGFFVELILTILFFAIACSIIVQIFAKASIMSQSALDQRGAAAQCQTLCETLKGGDTIEGFLPEGSYEKQQNGKHLIYYNEDWEPVPKAQAVYTIAVETENTLQPTGTLLKMSFEAKKDQSVLYTMDGAQYLQTGEVQ